MRYLLAIVVCFAEAFIACALIDAIGIKWPSGGGLPFVPAMILWFFFVIPTWHLITKKTHHPGCKEGDQPSVPPELPPLRLGQVDHEPASPESKPKSKRRMHGCLLGVLITFALLAVGLPLGVYIAGRVWTNYVKRTLAEAPLYVAVVRGDINEVDRLLKDGVSPNQTATLGWTALIAAVVRDHPLIAKRLLDAGADPEQRNNYGWAPLHHAIRPSSANLDMIEILVRHGANVDVTDRHLRTPLHRAAQFGHVEAVRLLLRLGADPGARDENGWTPLDRARAHPTIVEILQANRTLTVDEILTR